ncbi:MAG TPA: tRNA uracil 4-sulfurtransferase ThiI [Vicinamibacteria bacterium]|nr:tRNA uracil 4-sulfurtransferase ThiI [Vicinamibacteria bacterium]
MDAPSISLPVQIVIRSPEITLKGRNQGEFWVRLRTNVRRQLDRRGIVWPVVSSRAKLAVSAGCAPATLDLERAVAAVSEVAGVDSYSVARRADRNDLFSGDSLQRSALEEIVVAMARECYEPGKSFALRVHRVDKRFPLISAELEKWLGDAVRGRTSWSRVDLDSPDRTFYVDIHADALYFYSERKKGVGGLPVGTSGRVLSLLSGGIDSPVASFLLARRGAWVDWFHMSASHVSERDIASSVPGRLAGVLSRFSLESRLFVVPYTHFDLALAGGETGYEPVLFRRFLFRVGEALAARVGAAALVTGDSLAQVASQTLENLVTTSRAVEILLLRPLVGMDKQQIMDLARRIGTYDISIEPYKDCCALYARRVKTRTREEALSVLEARLFPDYAGLVERTLRDTLWGRYECGELLSMGTLADLANDRSESLVSSRPSRRQAEVEP